MDKAEEREAEIYREFDYSNSIPEIQVVSLLIQYCDFYYKQLIKLCKEDEEKNERLKYEYKNYLYKKSFNTNYEIVIREKESNFSNFTCKTYDSFIEAVNIGWVSNVESITITLDLSFKRGKNMDTKEHENLFKIILRPYNIVFTRKSNYEDENMDQVENTINEIMGKFRVQNTIFCTKQ